MRKLGRSDGFTLIELLVVMIIVGILAAIAIPTYLRQRTAAYKSAAVSDLGTLRTAVESYAIDHEGSYAGLNGATQDSAELAEEGFKGSHWVSITVTSDDDSYCAVAEHQHVLGEAYVVHSDEGRPELVPIASATCT